MKRKIENHDEIKMFMETQFEHIVVPFGKAN